MTQKPMSFDDFEFIIVAGNYYKINLLMSNNSDVKQFARDYDCTTKVL